MAQAEAREAPLPSKIGRHQVVGYIATGGMAELFLGKEPTGRPVVIKRILPHLARQGSFVSMFIDEARIGALAKHPNLVEVYELGQVGMDLFLVMEYLVGENLAGLVRRLVKRNERMSYGLSAYIIAEVCDGLHAAQELTDQDGKRLELVHRDVSPQNIFVTYGGDVKLLDFGVATAAHRLTQTASGEVKGKYAYMSPEQCRGEPLDRRSDIFSLGTVLYELTTLHRLFKRPNELQVMRAICEQPIPRPTHEVPDYPASLEAICTRALARDPAQRYSNAMEMREDLLHAMQELGLEGDPHEAIASKFARLFGDRVAQKQELMMRVRRGADLGDLPAAEVDEAIEVPIVSQGTATPLSNVRKPTAPVDATEVGPGRRRKTSSKRTKRHGWVYAAFAVAIAAGAGVGGWLRLRARDAAAAAAATTRDAGPRIEYEVTPVEVPPKHEFVVVSVDTDPAGVKVVLDGQDRGVTPIDIKLDKTDKPAKLELSATGFAPTSQQLVPDRDQRLFFSLRQKQIVRVPVSVPAKPAKKDKEKEKDKGPAFHRFD